MLSEYFFFVSICMGSIVLTVFDVWYRLFLVSLESLERFPELVWISIGVDFVDDVCPCLVVLVLVFDSDLSSYVVYCIS